MSVTSSVSVLYSKKTAIFLYIQYFATVQYESPFFFISSNRSCSVILVYWNCNPQNCISVHPKLSSGGEGRNLRHLGSSMMNCHRNACYHELIGLISIKQKCCCTLRTSGPEKLDEILVDGSWSHELLTPSKVQRTIIGWRRCSLFLD